MALLLVDSGNDLAIYQTITASAQLVIRLAYLPVTILLFRFSKRWV